MYSPKVMIKRIRVVLSVLVFVLITVLYLNVSHLEWFNNTFNGLLIIQFMPAVLSYMLGISIFWLLIVMMFGRLYCSTVCPLGTLQDIFSFLNKKIRSSKGFKTYYRYSEPRNTTRYAILWIVVIAMLLHLSIIPVLIDPFHAYKNIVSVFDFSTHEGHVFGNVILPALYGIGIGILTLIIVGYVSYKYGRLICNTVCPVGSTFSIISKNSVWQFEIDPDKCTACGKCEEVCKASCINLSDLKIDMSRCVVCFNCTAICPDDAIHYTASRKRLATPLMQKTKEERPQISTMGEADATTNYKNNIKK